MKKKHIAIEIIFIILIVIGLSGCTDQTNNTDKIDKLKVVDYTIYTEAYSHKTDWKSFGVGFQANDLPEIVTSEPPYLSEDYTKARYNISVTVKNIAGYTINPVIITLKFYDNNNSKLFSKQLNNFTKLQNSEIRTLKWEYYIIDEHYGDYFLYVDHFEISTEHKQYIIDPSN